MLALDQLLSGRNLSDLHSINANLTAGTIRAYVWRQEIYAEGVAKPLRPLGRLVQRLNLDFIGLWRDAFRFVMV